MIALTLDLARSRRVLLVSIAGGLLLLSIGYLALYPSLEGQLQAFTDDLPDAYKAFIGDADIGTPEGYIRSQVYSLISPLVIAGACIAAGASLARAERDQTLAVLAVTPLSRRQLAGAWCTLIMIAALVGALAAFIGVVVGAPLAGADVGIARVVLATVPLVAFGVLMGNIALLVSTLTGSPGTATGAGWAAILLSFIANSFAELIDALSWISKLNPWSWHGAGVALTNDFGFGSFVALVVAASTLGLAAVASFERRNLHL